MHYCEQLDGIGQAGLPDYGGKSTKDTSFSENHDNWHYSVSGNVGNLVILSI